ncbi:MAG: hypothetical protein V2A34_00255 [Lentisphaerota bacterium]
MKASKIVGWILWIIFALFCGAMCEHIIVHAQPSFPTSCLLHDSVWVTPDTCIELQLREDPYHQPQPDTILVWLPHLQELGYRCLDGLRRDSVVTGHAQIKYYDALARLRADSLGIKP